MRRSWQVGTVAGVGVMMLAMAVAPAVASERGRIAQAGPPGGASPGSVPPFDLPGASAPSPFARRVSITRSPLIVGPLPVGSGRVEHVGPTYLVVSSEGMSTWKPISREPARDLYATIRARVRRGSSDPAVAGLILSVRDGEFQDGDLFFGKVENQGLTVMRWEGARWAPVPGVRYAGRPVAPEEVDRFEITRHGGTYLLRANGLPVVTLEDPGSPPRWVQVFAGPGNRAEFFDWGVERPE